MWRSLLSDPSFSKQLAKTMQKDNETILKKLMKDPEYQSMMMDILKAPNMEKQYLDLMKTQPYRKQMERVVQDTLTSPLFASQLSDAIDKAVKKQMKQESKP
ncbi:spore germination lipoprotein GerD [Terrilactibacillus sp. S3-3]|nr:spore germination lipoprotein GerD [Terrilactibacillus sp. S3-3]